MNKTLQVTMTGFAIIGITYGFARFAYGLFLPEIAKELDLSITFSGFVAGGAFLGYCLSIIASSILTERFDARFVGVLAVLMATLGMLLIALSSSGIMLAIAILLAGISTGLASPPMAAAVSVMIPTKKQNLSNTIINAGSCAGIAISGPVAILFGADWRIAYGVFTGLSLIVLIISFFVLPSNYKSENTDKWTMPTFTPTLSKLCIAAFCMGFASTLVWSFGGQLLVRNIHDIGDKIGYLWIIIGVFSFPSAFSGALISKFGINIIHRLALVAMLLGTLIVAYSENSLLIVLLGGALFGMSYLMLTGVYLIWGVAALKSRPATGLTIAFLLIAIGQTLGSPVFGALIDTSFMLLIIPLLITILIAGFCAPKAN